MTTTYQVTGMSCAACAARIERALASLATGVTVTLDPPSATITGDHDLAALNAAAQRVGDYRLSPLTETAATAANKSWLVTYRPVLLIVAYIAVAALAGGANLDSWMMNFMAGFFLVFSFFKLLDPVGFATSYRMYDLVAARFPAWGRLYPYVELALGLAYLFRIGGPALLLITLVLMLLGAAGVIRALLDKKQIRCACLGSTLNLPLSSVALVENLGMAAMAALMLVIYL